jgi:hypothetical protein
VHDVFVPLNRLLEPCAALPRLFRHYKHVPEIVRTDFLTVHDVCVPRYRLFEPGAALPRLLRHFLLCCSGQAPA